MKRTYNLLSIVAWCDGPCNECDHCRDEDFENCTSPSWTWNDMHHVDTIDTIPQTVEEFLELVSNTKLTPEYVAQFAMDDNEYCLELSVVDKGEPIYAIAYGEEE